MLDADAAEVSDTRQEAPTMNAVPSHQRILPAIAAFAVGITVSSLIHTPFGLLAPLVALYLSASDRTGLLLHGASATGLAGCLLVAAIYEGEARDIAAVWAAFFALAICIGALVTPASSASPGAEAMPAAIQSTTRAQSYPAIGPTLEEKATPRHSPLVSISAQDDKASTARLVAVSFWADLPFHMRYWRCQPDGRYRWVESRSEPLREPSGTLLWHATTAEVDDRRSGKALPTKIASNPPRDGDAVRAAKLVENLLGNAWAFDPAGKPTYLTPLAQIFVGVTLEEFQAVVDEGHTFFKRTADPDDYERISAAWRRSLQTGDPFFLDRRIRRASGIHEWNRTGFVPTRDGQGRITGWYGSMIDLDSHRIAQAELRDRERELSQLVNLVPSHLWRLAPDGEPIFFNQRMVDFLGLGVADMDRPGRGRLEAMIETVHPDDAAEFRDTLHRCFATGESFALRYRLRRADGVYRWMSSRAEPMRNPDGTIAQWYGLCHDIDDQIHADEALRQSERQLQQLIDAVPVMIWSTTREGKPSYVNKRFTDVTGATLEDITAPDGSFNLSVIHPDDKATTAEMVGRSFSTGVPYVIQYRQLRRGRDYRWTETRAEALRDESGEILQWYGVSVDIHDLVTAQDALRRSEQELSQLVNMVPVYIRRLTPEGEPTFFNKRLTDFIGVDLAEIGTPGMGRLALAVENLIHPDEAAKLLAAVRLSVATGEGYSMKYRLLRADGVYRWIETRAEPVRNQDGTIAQWYSISIDVDDEVRAQQAEVALRETSEKLAKATHAASLAELSASIAHEVNQPLAAIVANSHACQRWLSAEPPNFERAKITVERVIRDANSAADVVGRIRALFRQSVETRTRATLPGVIAEARNLIAEEAARRRVRMDVDVEDNLPLVAFDRVQLQQVLINLIRNGMDAMESVAADRVIGMRVRRLGDVVQTEISDRGPGIKFPDRIFEPFFTTKEIGMGMGLAICRSIVESHGGRLWAEKDRPHGATFIFTLPVEEKAAP